MADRVSISDCLGKAIAYLGERYEGESREFRRASSHSGLCDAGAGDGSSKLTQEHGGESGQLSLKLDESSVVRWLR